MRSFFSIFILLVSLSSNSHAISNGDLYSICKPFADRKFELQEPADFVCQSYFFGTIEYGQYLCQQMEEAAKRSPNDVFTRSFFGASENALNEIQAIMQAYIENVKAEPNVWSYAPQSEIREIIWKLAPCK